MPFRLSLEYEPGDRPPDWRGLVAAVLLVAIVVAGIVLNGAPLR